MSDLVSAYLEFESILVQGSNSALQPNMYTVGCLYFLGFYLTYMIVKRDMIMNIVYIMYISIVEDGCAAGSLKFCCSIVLFKTLKWINK